MLWKKLQVKGPSQLLHVLLAGVNTVTTLVENKKAHLVVIAQGADPIELAVLLPDLFHQEKGQAGVVHSKTCTTVVFTQVN